MFSYNKKLIGSAQSLRKNMTPEEKHLWYDFLKNLPVTARRQKNIENYIVDFYISHNKIAIEIDGIQHSMPEKESADIKRDEALKALGITVLRYTNDDIRQRFNTVCEDILEHLEIKPCEMLSEQNKREDR